MNLFDYEKVLPPPIGLPQNLDSCYITDTESNFLTAQKLGWKIVKLTNKFQGITDKLQRRICIARIKCFPNEFVPEVSKYNYVFLCDSNIIKIRDDFDKFVRSCPKEKCLFLTSGYYQGNRDNIESELQSSFQQRWSYNFENMKSCTQRYIKELTDRNIDYKNLSVVSGKYIGWNLKHPLYSEISKKIYEERNLNLQGNIILTYIKGLYPKETFDFYTQKWARSQLQNHNFYA